MIFLICCNARDQSPESASSIRKNWIETFKKKLPAGAEQLEIKAALPSTTEQEKEALFENPCNMAQDFAGNIYVVDSKANCIFKFDTFGRFEKRLGRRGAGPGEFQSSNLISVSENNLVISDLRNGRIQLLDFEGNYLGSFKKFKGYFSITANKVGNILTAPQMMEGHENALIDVLSNDGQLLYSFGKPIEYREDSRLLNNIKIDVNGLGEVYIAFRFLAKVQKYSYKGALLAEYKIENEFMRERERRNLDNSKSKSIKSNNKKYISTIESVRTSKNGFYLLTNWHCPVLMQFDQTGKMIKYYYYLRPCVAVDFLVEKDADSFYLLIKYPDFSVDLLSPKN